MAASRAERSVWIEKTLAHYRERFATHGATPQGVDWNGPRSQRILFEQLLPLLPANRPFTLNDFGCGYGALADFLATRFDAFRYRGYDVNPAMIDAASRRYEGLDTIAFEVADRPSQEADYGVASGVFTLRLERSDEECLADMIESLDAIDRTSVHGFAFNCLTSYSDADRMQDYLYYPDPRDVFDVCKRRYARNVALLHDYDLYGFTVIVRKQLEAAP
jgi:SAM-dependent methyltransferase